MPGKLRVAKPRARHLDRGLALVVGGPVALLVVACSGALPQQTGTAGRTSNDAGDGGVAGTMVRGDAGVAGTGALGGAGGTCAPPSFPSGCGCQLPTGSAGFGCPSSGGRGGSAVGNSGGGPGSAGRAPATGGTGGSAPLPVCQDGVTPFGVCFVNDADTFPLPSGAQDTISQTMAATTVQEVGLGAAPASCESARVFGTRGTSDWWLQAKAGDGRLWTIGVRGLGNAPPAKKGDQVALTLFWNGTLRGLGYGPPSGELQLSDPSGRPLLWAGSINTGFMTTWMYLGRGDAACSFPADSCDMTRFNVAGAIDNQPVRMPPFGGAYIGSYFVAVGQPVSPVVDDTRCANYGGRSFDAAIVRVPVTPTSPSR